MRQVFPLLAVLTSLCCAQSGPQEQHDLARVRVVVTTTFGEPVGPVLAILRVGAIEKYRQLGKTINLEGIPFGAYELEVQASNFAIRRERVAIYQPYVRLWIGLSVSSVEAEERPEIAGSIARQNNQEDLWIRLVPFYSSDFVEDQVALSGDFQLRGVNPGRYLLLLFSKQKLIISKTLDYKGGKLIINLDLPR